MSGATSPFRYPASASQAPTAWTILCPTPSAAALPTSTGGSLRGADAANFLEAYASKNAGTGLMLTPSGTAGGNGGNNYSYTFVGNNTGTTNPEALIITAQTGTKTYDGT